MAKLLRIAEAAAILGVSPDTVRRWVEDGALPAVRTYGGQLRFREAEILTFQEQGQEPRSSDPDEGSDPPPQPAAQPPRKPRPNSPEWERMSPWDRKRAEVEAEFAINDMFAERRSRRRQRKQEEQAELASEAERERLAELKRYGLRMCAHSDQRHRLVRLLEHFVTAKQIPAYLSQAEQQQPVRDRVSRFNSACWEEWGRSLRGE